MELKAKINKSKAIEAIRQFPEIAGKNLRLATKISLRDIKVGAQRDHAFISRGGFAERSISDEVNASGIGGRVFLDTGIAHYGPFLHMGTGIHGPARRPIRIVPVNKKALRFVKGGRFIFARGVTNPGIRPDPFLYRSAEKNEPLIGKRFNDAIDKTIVQGGLK